MVHSSLAAAQAMKDCWLCFHAVTRKNDSMSNLDSFRKRILDGNIFMPRKGKSLYLSIVKIILPRDG
jgi:hypothetical protein